jgi:hypothetical protein
MRLAGTPPERREPSEESAPNSRCQRSIERYNQRHNVHLNVAKGFRPCSASLPREGLPMITMLAISRALLSAMPCLLPFDLVVTEPAAKHMAPKYAWAVPPVPTLKAGSGSVAPPEMLSNVLKANEPWLRPQTNPHSYTFSMQHTNAADCWEALAEFDGRERMSVLPGPHAKESFPPRQGRLVSFRMEEQIVFLQGVYYLTPLYALARLPDKYKVRSLGKAKLHGIAAQVLHVRAAKFNEAAEPSSLPPDSYLRINFGCGLYNVQYGGGNDAADLDQVWVENGTNRPLREEGFICGQCRFLIEYGDYEKVSDRSAVPRHIVLTMFRVPSDPPDPPGWENIYPWAFDMEFTLHGGKVWLLKRLTETQNGKICATAGIRDVKLLVQH